MDTSRITVLKNMVWAYSERLATQIISFIITIVLARILDPGDFGIIAIVTVLITIADVFATSGFGNALIQKKDSTAEDYSTMLVVSLTVSVISYGVLFVAADPIAFFFNMDLLAPVIRVMALRLPIAAFNSIQQAYISNRMQFRKSFISNFIGAIVSAVVGISLALAGYGVWSLVAQYLCNVAIGTLVLFAISGWRPIGRMDCKSAAGLISYGWKVLASSLLISIYSGARDLVVGKIFSANVLAFYNMGQKIPALIATNAFNSIARVLFPALSEQQDDLERLRSMERRAISLGTYILAPILIGIAFAAEPLVRLVLSDKWIECVPFLIVMCGVYLFQPIQVAAIQSINAIGRSDVYLKLEIAKKIIGTIILIITIVAFDDVFAIAVGAFLAELVSTLLNVPANKKLIGYAYLDQLRDFLPQIVASVAMGSLVYAVSLLHLNLPITVIMQVVTGIASYLIISIIFKIDDFLYIIDMVKQRH